MARFKHYKSDGAKIYINGVAHECEGVEVIESDVANLHINSLESDISNFIYSTFQGCEYIEMGEGYLRVRRGNQEVFLELTATTVPEKSDSEEGE
jgi:hypothetical protein